MKIMYVTSECAPFIKTGGLGDVAGSLPKALAAKGHDVRVFCPLYSAISEEMREKFFYIKNAYVRLGWRNQYCGIFRYEKDCSNLGWLFCSYHGYLPGIQKLFISD